ncbi:hypothetical protein ABZ479_26480 [Streptomyces sp. NPDC005722]
MLRNLLVDLSARGFVESVAVEVKTVPVTPVVKVYVLNKTQSLIGYYSVTQDHALLDDGAAGRIYDALGVGARLFAQNTEQLPECQQWFDSLWLTIREPASRLG